tara:strand:- start:287 stop:397 length:111 start_codon:yes stop_codon:yes gene_type:complete
MPFLSEYGVVMVEHSVEDLEANFTDRRSESNNLVSL